MTKTVSKTLTGQTIHLDNHDYDGCTFLRCRIVYSGTGPYRLTNNTIDGCTFHLHGPAANSIEYLRVLYNEFGLKGFVEAIFDKIRNNEPFLKDDTLS